MKTFNVAQAQASARCSRNDMCGRRYAHYKGGEYVVMSVDVDEASGGIRVSYWSLDKNFHWSRTLEDFNATVRVDGALVPRFTRRGR